MCDLEDCCGDFHVWSDKKCHHIGKYLAQLSTQCDRKAKASSSSFQGSSLHCLFLVKLTIPSMCRCYDSFVVVSVFGDLFDFYSCGRVYTVCSSECYARGTFAFTLFAAPLNVTPGTFEQVAS